MEEIKCFFLLLHIIFSVEFWNNSFRDTLNTKEFPIRIAQRAKNRVKTDHLSFYAIF